MKNKKKLLTLSAVLVLIALIAVFWNPIIDFLPIDQSRWKQKDGVYFYLDEDGDPVSGWYEIDGNRHYFAPDSHIMQTDWLELEEGRYYLGSNGVMQTGWLELENSTYYLNRDGRMQTGWLELEKDRYHFGSDGKASSGWLELEEGRFYLKQQGKAITGWHQIEGQTYHFAPDGLLHLGWQQIEEDLYYFGDSGIMQTGWVDREETRYYLGSDGAALTGWQDIDGARYCFTYDGMMLRGWQQVDEGYYCFSESGVMQTGWANNGDAQYYLSDEGTPLTGWQDIDGARYCFDPNGIMLRGWVTEGDLRFYLDEDGSMHTGWLNTDGKTYYLNENGNPVKGRLDLDGTKYYFTSTGENILLVNRWNPVPEGYTTELKTLPNGRKIGAVCYDELMQMIEDCKAAGNHPNIVGAYRSLSDQRSLFNTKLQSYQAQGGGNAYERTARQVAIPGTSEHQLGLAVDITDKTSTSSACEKWLHEHCWEYGFIVRYTKDTTHITGIMYEYWHYRYVGRELAKELTELGICMEEYMDMLTGDGITCGDPSYTPPQASSAKDAA